MKSNEASISLERVTDMVRNAGVEPAGIAVGPLRLWFRLREGDLLVCQERDESEIGLGFRSLESPPEGVKWSRIAGSNDLSRLRVIPGMPDRAIVVRPTEATTLLPGERVPFFIGVPMSVSLCRNEEKPFWTATVLSLSKTWFGTPMAGELCYALRSEAWHEGGGLDFAPWRIVCPVRIKNQTKEPLTFERLCLRVKYLSIFHDADQGYWANPSSVIFRGEETESRVAYGRQPPAELKSPTRVVEGEADPQGTFLQRALVQGRGFFND